MALGLIGLGLYGCAEPGPRPAARATAGVADRQMVPAPAARARYKVGEPYQITGTWYYPKEDYSYRETGIASWYGPGFNGRLTANGEVYDQAALTAAHRTLPMPSMVRVVNLENGRSIKVRINDRGPFARSRVIDVSQRAAELLGFRQKGTAKVLVEIIEGESRQLASATLADEVAEAAPDAVPTVAVTAEALPGSRAPTQVSSPAAWQTALAVPYRAISTVPPVSAGVGQGLDRLPAPMADASVTSWPIDASEIYVQAGAFTRFDNANRLRARLSRLGDVRIASALIEDRQYFRVQIGPVPSVDAADRLLDLLLANGHSDARVVVD